MPHPSWADIAAAAAPSPASSSGSDGEGSGSGSSRANAAARRRPAWHTYDTDVTDFGPASLGDEGFVVGRCSECGRVVERSYWSFHLENCNLALSIASGRLSPSCIAPVSASGRKRKASVGSDSDAPLSSGIPLTGPNGKPLSKKARREQEVLQRRLEREKKKEEKKLKGAGLNKRAGPLNVDKQCGVPTDKGLCARSLTCKTHSMKAKRDVPGRSATYDALLLAYQKAHNPNFVAKLQEKEKALAATAEAKAKRLREKSKQRKRGGAAGKEAQALDERRDDEEEPPEQEEDLEEELEGILDALRAAAQGDRTRALPLAVPSLAGAYTARRRKLMRCRDLFRASIMASHGSYAPALPFVMASQGSAPPSARMAAANQAAAAGQRGIPWANAFVNGGAHPGPPPGWPNGAPPRPQPASGP